MNKTVLDGKRHQLQGALREQWGRLTDDDIRILMGRLESLGGMLEERYGYSRATAEAEVNDFLERSGYRTPSLRTRMRRAVGRRPWLLGAGIAAGAMLLVVTFVAWRTLQSEEIDLTPTAGSAKTTGDENRVRGEQPESADMQPEPTSGS